MSAAEPARPYAHLTAWPHEAHNGRDLVIATGHPPALPALVEPAAQPPVQFDNGETLVEVATIPGVVDLTAYRSVGWADAVEKSLVRSAVADRLARVTDRLPPGFGLAVFDAWRPATLQKALYDDAYADPTLPPGFVTPPSNVPSTPPPHATGGAVDLTLTFDGQPLALGTLFDDFTPRARADALEGTGTLAERLRRLLFQHMSGAGFVMIDCEWWHFEFGTRRWAAILGIEPVYGPAISEHQVVLPRTFAA